MKKIILSRQSTRMKKLSLSYSRRWWRLRGYDCNEDIDNDLYGSKLDSLGEVLFCRGVVANMEQPSILVLFAVMLWSERVEIASSLINFWIPIIHSTTIAVTIINGLIATIKQRRVYVCFEHFWQLIILYLLLFIFIAGVLGLSLIHIWRCRRRG